MSKPNIHPTAIVSDQVKLGNDVKVGPYSILEGNIQIGDGTVIEGHTFLKGNVSIGNNNHIYQFCSIGDYPQDISYNGEDTYIEIGDNNIIREYVSIHRGTTKDDYITKIGNNNFLMGHVHVAHDVKLSNKCILVNSVNLAGHVKVGDGVIIGGGTFISQFVSIGRGSYLGGASAVDRDVPAFCTAYGNRARLKGVNIIGLRRQSYAKEVITEVVDFFRTMEASALSPGSFIKHEEFMKDFINNEIIKEMIENIKNSEVGIAPFAS